MLFNSLSFLFFLPVVLVLYYVFRSRLRVQNMILLLASFVFYAYWDWRFLGLILLSIGVDFCCGLKMEKAEDKDKRKFLLLSLIVNLGVLSIYKYLDFFIESFVDSMGALGLDLDIHAVGLILPLGISFYTFQTLAYTIDVYRSKIHAEKDVFNFALYVCFFPQLVAGPIERAQNLLPQIKSERKISLNDFYEASWLIYFGYFLKVFVADNLAFIVDEVFNAEIYTQASTALASYAFAFQIYGDFAGYTFIAIGVARLMGFRLMTNFLFPYFVTNPSDFWKNWHISLSSWLKDYLYIPLGGNRLGKYLTLRNLMITMVLGGLWHGAAWNFVLWGTFHGIILIVFRLLSKDSVPMKASYYTWQRWIKAVLFFQLTCMAWVFFRAESLTQIYEMLSSLCRFESITQVEINYLKQIVFYTFLPIIILYFQFKHGTENQITKFHPIARAILYVVMFYAIFSFGEFGAKEFIYFQF